MGRKICIVDAADSVHKTASEWVYFGNLVSTRRDISKVDYFMIRNSIHGVADGRAPLEFASMDIRWAQIHSLEGGHIFILIVGNSPAWAWHAPTNFVLTKYDYFVSVFLGEEEFCMYQPKQFGNQCLVHKSSYIDCQGEWASCLCMECLEVDMILKRAKYAT